MPHCAITCVLHGCKERASWLWSQLMGPPPPWREHAHVNVSACSDLADPTTSSPSPWPLPGKNLLMPTSSGHTCSPKLSLESPLEQLPSLSQSAHITLCGPLAAHTAPHAEVPERLPGRQVTSCFSSVLLVSSWILRSVYWVPWWTPLYFHGASLCCCS